MPPRPSTDCADCPLRRKGAFHPFTEEELRFMRRFKVGELVVDAGTPLLAEGSNAPQLFTALRGLGLRYKTLPNGRRQVVNFVFPGDFIGLQAGIMGEMSHSVEATTRMTLCVFNRSDFWNFVKGNSARAFDLIWLSAVEENVLGEALTSVGQRTAVERIAWALVRITQRARALGLDDGYAIPLPYRQQDLADALGLSLVHTNKTIARLRERQLITWAGGRLSVPDLPALAAIAHMDLEAVTPRPLI